MKLFGSAVILAGGKSSRMGFDKAFINVNGMTLIHIIMEQLAVVFEDIIVVTNTPDMYEGLKAKIITDIVKGAGPLGGIHSGLKTAQSKYVFVIACDMPFICFDYIGYMKDIVLTELPDAVISCKGDWVEPFHAFYSTDIITDIESNMSKKKFKIYDILKDRFIAWIAEEKVREYSPGLELFINLNNSKDLAQFDMLVKKRRELNELFS